MNGVVRGFAESPQAWIEATGHGRINVNAAAAMVACATPAHARSAKLCATASYLAPPPRVCTVPCGLVLGNEGAAAAPDGVVFLSTLFRPAIPTLGHPVWRIEAAQPSRRVPGVVGLLTHHGGNNVSHVLADGLPRLWLLLQHMPRPDVFVLSANAPHWRNELFERAGLPLERCVFIGADETLETDALLLPERTGFTWGVAPWAPPAVRSLLGTPPRRFAGRRLWVSRAHCPKRRWVHEREAEPSLRRRGFELVRLEELTISEQLALVSEAAVIAGPHGAGLAWAIAAPDGGLLFELASPDHVHNDFRALAEVSGWLYDRTPAAPVPICERGGDPPDVELAVLPDVLLEWLDPALAAATPRLA